MEAILSRKPNSESAEGTHLSVRRRWPTGHVGMLRDLLFQADNDYLAATTAEERRVAILTALRGVLEFNRSQIPSIRSVALTRHFEKFTELLFGKQDETFKKSRGHGLTTSGDDKARDALIAVAFKLLTEGGQRKGNLGREEAGRFIATELNRLRIKDRGGQFATKRIVNIYLEVVRTRSPREVSGKAASVAEIAVAVMRDRENRLASRIYMGSDKCH